MLLESFKKYVERCLNMGALSLNHLDRIEEKLLEDSGFDVFHAMGYGRFLEFILREAKQVIYLVLLEKNESIQVAERLVVQSIVS